MLCTNTTKQKGLIVETEHELKSCIEYLSDFDFIFKLVKAIIQPSKFVDVLLVLPCHFRLRSTPLFGLKKQKRSALT